MMPVPRVTKPPKIQRISVRSWEGGTATAFDDRRTPLNALRSSGNLTLEQDSVPRPRPSLVPYGPQPLGIVLGEVFEFRVTSAGTNVNWLISIQNVEGTAKVYVARGEDSTWTPVSGKTYSTTARAHFFQINNNIVIMNGEDYLSFMDTSAMAITAFTTLANPTAGPTLDVNTGLTGSTAFKVYYAITYNSTIGETAGSGVLTLSIAADRDMWNPETQSIRIKWNAPPANVKSVNVYIGVSVDGQGAPTLYQAVSGLPVDQLQFTDNGSRALNDQIPLPKDNSTAGPRATRGAVINGRAWLVGDKDNPFIVWRGGDYKNELDFSPGNGGGRVPVGTGTKEVPVSVKPYRDGKGDPKVTVLSQGTNGSGRRYLLYPNQMTYGSAMITFWEVSEDTGDDGTDSPDGVIIHNNDLWYPSRDGFKKTGTAAQLQNVLSTNRITEPIQNDIQTLRSSAMNRAVGLAFEGKLYWSVPVNSDRNNQLWMFDPMNGGKWMKPWSVKADWMTLYNDYTGRTHFLVVQDNKILEFSYASKTFELGKPFATSGSSGQIRFDKDGREWARLIRVIFTVMRPQGPINFSVNGLTEDGILPFRVSETFGANATRAGWGEPRAGWGKRGWSRVKATPKTFNPPSEEVEIEIEEDMQWFQYSWNSSEAGVDYAISDVVAEFINVGIKDLS